MITAVIFDMDGTLIDSEPVHKQIEQQLLREHGLDLSIDDLVPYSGLPIEDYFQAIRDDHGGDFDPQDLADEKQERYRDRIDDIQPMPGAVQTVNDLADDYQIGLATSSRRENMERIVDNLGLSDTFQTLQSADDVEHGKPAPDIFLQAAEQLGVQPGNAVVIEDSERGVEAANRGGFHVIGFQSREGDDLSAADTVVQRMDQLPAAIRDLD